MALTLATAQEKELLDAIAVAESKTSGEIRVHIENRLAGTVLARAAEVFAQLGMDKTDERNGVLFYIAITDRKFAVIGDKGIDEKVPAAFWDTVRDAVQQHFKDGDFVGGLALGVTMAGDELAKNFPRNADDKNELSDDISINDN